MTDRNESVMLEVVTLGIPIGEAQKSEVTCTIGGCPSGLDPILTAHPVFFSLCQPSCLSRAQPEVVPGVPSILTSPFSDPVV